ncbi:MAG: acyl--CoA ligase [Ectothiorhodospiraceae bacterium]|nr:acyl--CoA ligase [Ectothiorhodospiraceae bacterium]
MSEETPSRAPFSTMLAEAAKRRGDAAAVYAGDRRLSWSELHTDLKRLANGLRALGIGPNDKVATLDYSTAAHLEIYLGTVLAGGVAVPLSAMATSEQIKGMVQDCQAKVLAVSAAMLPLVEPWLAEVRPQLADGGLIAIDFQADGWTGLQDWMAGQADTAVSHVPDLDDGFNIIYSSGTTGTPKGILHPHRMREFQIQRMANFGLDGDATTLVSTPLYSNTTLVAVLPTVAFGGELVLMEKFNEARFLELAEKHRVSHAMLVPVQYQRLLEHPDFERRDLSSFRMKLCTSAPLRRSVKEAVLERWPGALCEVYGLTEGGVSTTLNCGEFPDKLHTVGRPAEGVDVRIIDDQGKELPQGEIGEIVGRSTAMMQGYHGRKDLTEALYWYNAEGELYYRSGDMGRFDEDGFIELLDRKKDMIISGGFNIYATDLEQVLLSHDKVSDAAVVGVPSNRWGETPVAFVVTSEADMESLRAWANDQLGKGQRIAVIEPMEELPRSVIGKVLKRELREAFVKQNPDKVE